MPAETKIAQEILNAEILNTKEVSVHFGGLRAVEKVDMSVRRGTIHGIIGPNGAGKTTLFNALTGFQKLTAGKIFFRGADITGLPPEKIAARGMSRTFQNIKLFSALSVLENVRTGFHSKLKTGLFDALFHTFAYKRDESFATEKGLEILEWVGLRDQAETRAANLAYGTRRKLEIARALALDPDILLLDEPAAGMNPVETKELMKLIQVINETGRTIVVIEHDMKLIMNVCDYITVLNQGVKICEGPPSHIRKDPRVIEAYLGRSHSA
ncbi:MAG: ABC transporter ATP-binding protein [Synergistaceae bacterium]|jgi:branched-chain amino acid transport system ATP-binding protein|nr:ABC transporter ATP-binding protein [Synergistaceae bacterium]